MEATHPCLLYFGKRTLADTFPLLLVVGREPNCDQSVSAIVGPYDFRAKPYGPRTPFWSLSYSLAGRHSPPNGISAAELKARCVDASPIIYADAMPRGISVRATAKMKRECRRSISDDEIRDHVAAVFSHEHLISRVRLVILSGLAAPEFQRSVATYKSHCAARDLPVAEVDFFYGENMSAIHTQMAGNAEATDALTQIMAEFS